MGRNATYAPNNCHLRLRARAQQHMSMKVHSHLERNETNKSSRTRRHILRSHVRPYSAACLILRDSKSAPPPPPPSPPIVIAHVSIQASRGESISTAGGYNKTHNTVKKKCRSSEVGCAFHKGRSWRSALSLIQSVRGKHD